MSRAENKASRLLQIEALLLGHPEGLSQAEIARRLGVHRSIIHRDLPDLTGRFPIYESEDGRLFIDRSAYLVNVSFSLHEAVAVHLASRLLATRMDRQNPHAAAALRKLGLALERLAPRVSQHLQQSADVMDDAAQRHDPVYLQALEKLTLAWAGRRKVQVWHRHEATGNVYEYRFSPYFIEPYAIGQTTHVFGYREPPGALRTFKIERIERVELTQEPYSLPEDFDPRELLSDAWGVWYTDAEPVQVALKFHPRVARRVEETRWHRSQAIETLPDGYLLWRAKIAEPQEMLPWIRGWGADVEVLEPEGLREVLVKEVKGMARVYGIESKPDDDLIAHWRKRDKQAQSLLTHLVETSELAERFAAKVGLPEVGKILGLLHDFGKSGDKYQNYLRSGEGLINPDEDEYVDYIAQKGKIDHSTAGAQLVYQKFASRGREGKYLAQFLALAMASHHSGLIDCLTPDGKNNFQRRMDKPDEETYFTEAVKKLPNIERQLNEILAQPIEKHFFEKLKGMEDENESGSTLPFKHGLLVRFLLSCLLDADRLNTADFETPENEVARNYGKYHPWSVLIERIEHKFAEFTRETEQLDTGSRAYEVNQLRAQVAQACLDFSKKPKGIYQLTVPTGGGKTLASLRFALHHAAEHKMDRVFYIVPYLTIIDQNACEVRKVLDDMDEDGKPLDKVVLEHHSNFVPAEDTRRRHSLLAENWDAPIVFTTQVQFLEALFGSGTRDPRRMHQLANSVIILDEVQTVPVKIVHMLNTALRFLVHDCGSTVVLCTATQPPLDKLPDNPYRALIIKPEQKIIQDEQELFEKLRRVEVQDERKPGGWTWEEMADLAERALQEKGSVLAVMNTRASARALYEAIKSRKLAKIYHLSTNMCPAHRLKVSKRIKARLKYKEPVICVSTQLIEAGVDIDFGAVIRALAGLDSIAQSAGRCNRHGVREGLGSVWVVNPQEENLDRLPDIKAGREKAQTVLDDFRDNPEQFGSDRIGLSAIAAYYRYYYHVKKDEMRYPVGANSPVGRSDDLFNLLSLNELSVGAYQRIHQAALDILLRQSFRSAGKSFQVIDSVTRGIVVPYEGGEMVIADLCGASELEKQFNLLKKAQRYSANLFTHEFDKLFKIGAIKEVQPGAGIYHLDEQYYSKEFGWSDEPVGDMKTHIV